MAAAAIPAALSLLSTAATLANSVKNPNANNANPSPMTIPGMIAAVGPPLLSLVTPSPPAQPTSNPMPSAPPGGNNNGGGATNAGTTTTNANNATTQQQTMCIVCNVRPRYNDGTKTHPYCSKTCAGKAKNNCANGSTATQPQANGASNNASGNNCDFCHQRPKYFDGSKTHPFCSKACSKRAGTSRQNSYAKQPPAANGHAANAGHHAIGNTKLCKAPGCQNPRHTNNNGQQVAKYCSMVHKTIGEEICLLCRQARKLPKSHFCSQKCSDDAELKGPMILKVPRDHVTFRSVADQFKASWRHNSHPPPVRRVYKILAPKASLDNYEAYKTAVETRGQHAAAGRPVANENRRWHGTRRECNLGDKGHEQFCSSSTCSLCCIVRTSFDLNLFGKKTGWGRFGRGIYTSSTSSKSNDYSQNLTQSRLKAILLNKVVVGKGCKMTHDNPTLTAPPAGFDSVLAEKGGTLNHDELVVYANDAIRPSFLVMYEP